MPRPNAITYEQCTNAINECNDAIENVENYRR